MTGVRRTVYAPIQAGIRVSIVSTPAGMATVRASAYSSRKSCCGALAAAAFAAAALAAARELRDICATAGASLSRGPHSRVFGR
eukprot:4736753-Prymnesium_polylepis.1